MSTVKFNLGPAGLGELLVDGVNLSKITSGVNIVTSAGEPTKVTVDLGCCKLEDIVIEGADLDIKGDRIPESVQVALYDFLRKKLGPVDVTVMADESQKIAIMRV